MRYWLLFFLLIPSLSIGQVVDGFNDGNFSSLPAWSGMDSHFVVSSGQELQLLASPISSESFLSTSNSLIDSIEWKIRCRMDFNPSSSNKAYIYLVSDSADLRGALNGYFVMLGNTNDEVSLYRQQGSVQTKIIDGLDGSLNTATVDLNIRVRRDANGNWTLEQDVNGSWTLEGQVLDTLVKTSSYFGVLCDYTSTRADKFFFDDVFVGYEIGDTAAPELLSIDFPDSNKMLLLFNEPLELTSAQTSSNYSLVSGQTNIASASLQGNPTELVLQFSSALNLGVVDTLRIVNVSDTSGNRIVELKRPFQFVFFDSALVKDVVVNEFMADPSPPVALPEAEFIELFNVSSKNFNLDLWTLSDASSTVPLPSHQFFSGEYLILCKSADSLALSAFGNVLSLSSMPALNNSGDDIRLEDSYGNVIDELSYDLSWYKDDQKDEGGFSLEKINPNPPCDGLTNWTASNSLDGGTPGKINSVFSLQPDTAAPKLTRWSIPDPNSIRLYFDENISLIPFSDTSFLSLNNQSIEFDTAISLSENSVELSLLNPLDDAIAFELLIQGVLDCYGNRSSEIVQMGRGLAPDLLDFLITEIHSKPDPEKASLPNAEFLEITCLAEHPIELGGVLLSDLSTESSLDSHLLFPGERLILCDVSDVLEFQVYGDVLGVQNFPSLNNSGDVISFRLAGNAAILRLEYSDEWYGDEVKKEGGYTLEIKDPSRLCLGSENWTASASNTGGTPGSLTSVYEKIDNLLPEALSAFGEEESLIVVKLSEPIIYEELLEPDFSIRPFVEVSSWELSAEDELSIGLNDPLEKGLNYELELDIKDCEGLLNGGFVLEFQLSEKGSSGDLVINEILFNPNYDGGTDYIELINRSDKLINLKNWSFANTDLNEDTIETERLITTGNLLIEANEIICFSENSEELLNLYPEALESQLVQIDDLPSMSNGQGVVILISDSAGVVDSLYYEEGHHSPLLRDFNGKSLERIDPKGNSIDPNNWQTAGQDVGFGTPGRQNSQFIDTKLEASSITIEPSIFSPDGDGYNDVLNIGYGFEETGLYANLWILDRNGRLVRRLANNVLLSPQGNFFWNGLNDEGHKMTLGLYVVYMEVFDSQGNVERFKVPVTLAGKL